MSLLYRCRKVTQGRVTVCCLGMIEKGFLKALSKDMVDPWAVRKWKSCHGWFPSKAKNEIKKTVSFIQMKGHLQSWKCCTSFGYGAAARSVLQRGGSAFPNSVCRRRKGFKLVWKWRALQKYEVSEALSLCVPLSVSHKKSRISRVVSSLISLSKWTSSF